MQVRPTGPGPAKTGEGLTGCDGGQQGWAGHERIPAGLVCAGHRRLPAGLVRAGHGRGAVTVASTGGLGTGEGLTGCDDGKHGRTGHGRVPAGPVRVLCSKGRMKLPLKPDGQ